jgi:hypothetical protein
MIVINANTLAISEYDISALDVLEYEDEVYFASASGMTKLSADGEEAVVSTLKTGQIDFDTTVGKRCPTISLISQNASIPEVSIVDDALTEYPCALKQGFNSVYMRTYNAPRGVLSTRLGFVVEGEELNFTEIVAEVIPSATR